MARYRAPAGHRVFMPGSAFELDDATAHIMQSLHGRLGRLPDDPSAEPPRTMPVDGESTAMDLGPADVHTAGASAEDERKR